jgi:hypothetical protein
MKKNAFFILMALFATNLSLSQGLGVGAGLSFWTGNEITKNTLNLIKEEKNPGFNINARIKVGGSDYMKYVFNAGWNKFVVDKVTIVDPRSNDQYELTLSQNVFPLTAGIQLNLPLEIIRLYVSGDIAYNIIRNSIDYSKPIGGTSVSIPVMFGDKTTYRIGAAPGVGAEIKLGIILLDASVKVHFMNLINKEADETSTTFVMANLSVFFQN